jgi:anti-sigma regulatory factor (Ser/Thr protein kinase)
VSQDPAPEAVRLQMRVNRQSPRLARSFVRVCIETFTTGDAAKAELLTSETVTNSLEHADTESVVIDVECNAHLVRVSVEDSDPTPPKLRDPDPATVGGFGVWLIADLADDWGVDELGHDGKRVWFEVALT